MCGFVGILGSNLNIKDKISDAIESIKHRGSIDSKPNFYFSDSYSCAFYRLSIIDLHSRSNQPYKKDGFNFILCFNGEIYNYYELKTFLTTKGYVFSGMSDTELVYYAFDFWGDKCFANFRGMFAIAIFDIKQNNLYLCRDHLGIKPLYYSNSFKNVYFASEIKALRTFVGFSANEDNIFEFLTYGNNIDENTIFKDIFEVNPGEMIKIDTDLKSKKIKYFNLCDTFYNEQDIDYDEIKFLLEESVRLHCNCDVKYASQLSGGLDSSFITALAKKQNPNLQSFSIRFENKVIDESKFQNLLIKDLKLQSYFLVYDDFFNLEKMKEAVYFEDFPLHHPNILASNELNKMALDKGNKMLLSGDGADELFCGYNWHLFNGNNLDLQDELNFLSYAPINKLKMALNLKQKPLNKDLINELNIIPKEQIMVYLGQKIYIQKWLRRQDRSGMQNSLEIRVPFVDVELFKKINTYSLKAKTRNYTNNKFILKNIAKFYIKDDIIFQRKIGFPMPIKEYFKDKKANIFWGLLRSQRAKQRGIYNIAYINNLIENHQKNIEDNSRILWVLLNLELWFIVFIDE
ncbi:asparagine synthase (glutamine-hydrolyzing) [Campylobacter hyointestinalis subsp. hyointestinalis]|uniref:asparagine synthase (glutamine-hydrolyzing) n=1 Tax=Campylobacter hyointestinalis TaxID=198 RepID=UPI0010FF90D0|nr:asparagine synthase (glutamine-hydrolyzing) [Campylobacter hyointestinalis]QCT99145.1 asparagine synthase (glutamine-hydrolyzing) [Campylobacter hyointestinalis subsp. hyointestinalis]